MPGTRPFWAKVLKATTLCIAVGTVSIFGLTAAVVVYPGLPVLWRPVHYTASTCNSWKVVRDSYDRKRWYKVIDQIRANSHIVQSDSTYTQWDTPRGRFWIPTGTAVLPFILAQHVVDYYGDSEWGVHPGDVVLDCGAFIGDYAKDALSRGAKLVVAIDPAPGPVECMRRNLASEISAGRVIIEPKGIWDSVGTLRLFLNGNSDAADSFVVHTAYTPAVEVPTTTIDALVKELGIARVDLIKTDIKGATERFLNGARDTIHRFHPRLSIATEEPPEDDGRVAAMVQKIAPYQMRCGHCFLAGDEIRMETLQFK